jgi:hypothetical protein
MQLVSRKPKPSLQARRAERELFFWTARQVLKLVTLGALVVYVIVSMTHGQVPGLDLLLRSI